MNLYFIADVRILKDIFENKGINPKYNCVTEAKLEFTVQIIMSGAAHKGGISNLFQTLWLKVHLLLYNKIVQ